MTEVRPYPLLLAPILHERVWGGRTLARFGKPLPTDGTFGESWEIADLPAAISRGRSTITNGAWRGRTLRDAIEADRRAVMGSAELSEEGGFPLLVKLLDPLQDPLFCAQLLENSVDVTQRGDVLQPDLEVGDLQKEVAVCR